MAFELPKLNYAYDALEPYIDAKTMEIHHTKHHQGYTDKLNIALEKYPELAEKSIEELLGQIDNLPVAEVDRVAIRNNGGGYANHKLFWEVMDPAKELNESLVEKINETFGSVDAMKELFNDVATKQFGSGWAWLVSDAEGNLEVYSTSNQDSPLSQGYTPILTLDVWEHAYYLKYQNKRPDYISAWWNIVKIV